jgi:FSR family fosmidomycin resistance protein-like MFS transporter
MNQRGRSLEFGGGTIFFFLLSISLGTLTGGYLSDRISRRKLIIFSLLLSAPFFFAMVHSTGIMLFVCLLFSGAMLGLSNPVPLTIAQELIPEGASTASSIMMGFSWGLAGMLALPFGMLSDLFGGNVVPAMSIAAILPVIAATLSIFLPRK